MEDGRAVVRGFAGANISTLVHEIGHIFRRDLKDADLKTMLDWTNSQLRADEFRELEQRYWSKDDTLSDLAKEEYVRIEEQFARGWERYLADGIAPNAGLRRIFGQLKTWLLGIYKQIRGSAIDVEISPEMRRVFEGLVGEAGQSLGDLVNERMTAIREGGPTRRMNDEAVSRLAKEQAIESVLGEFTSDVHLSSAIRFEQEMPGSWTYEVDYDLALEAAEMMREEGITPPWERRPLEIVAGKRNIARSTLDPRVSYEFEYAVVDVSGLITSDDWQGDQLKPNPKYDQRLQERSRDQAGSVQQANVIAARLVPEELIQETTALDRGAPIIGNDGMVESGNGRTIAIKRAITNYPENYTAYKTRLAEMAPEMGIDPASFAGMEHPVLVRVRKSEVDRVAFAREGNASITLEKTVSETARNDAGKISPEMLKNLEVGDNETIENALVANRNNGFVQQFLNKLNPNERNSISEDGVLNANGIRRMIHAILAAVFTGEAGERMRDAFINSVNVDVQAARTAIYQALPQMVVAEGMVKMGTRAADLSITNDLATAVNTLADIRNNPRVSLSDYLNQMTLIAEGELTPDQKVLLRWIGEAKGNAKKIREVLREYARIVIENEPDPNQGSLFGESMQRTKGEVIDAAIRKVEREYGIERGAEPTTPEQGTVVGTELAEPEPGGETEGRGDTTGDRTPEERAAEARAEAEERRTANAQERWDNGQPLTLEEVQGIKIDPVLMGTFGKEFYKDLWWPSKNMTKRYPQMQEGLWFVRSKPINRNGKGVYGAVFMDGYLVAYTNFSGHNAMETAQGPAVMLGTDPKNARQWVYLLTETGELGWIDFDAPRLEQRGGMSQGDLFGQSADDLPLFSGTPVKVEGERFAPRAEAQQPSMFPDMAPVQRPRQLVEITVIDEQGTAHYKVPLTEMSTIKRIERTNRNADVHYAVMDARGRVVMEGENLQEVITPTVRGTEEAPALFQEVSPEEQAAARERNITQGKSALETAIHEQRDVERAFLRPEIGEIDLVWGEEGDPQRGYKGGKGLSHIIAKRTAEGIDGVAFARSLYEVIANGTVQPVYTAGGDPRQIITLDERVVVLSLMEHGKERIWVLTGYIDKKISGAPGEVFPSSGATSTTPSFSRRDRGAEINDSLAQEGNEFNTSGQVVDSTGAMLQATMEPVSRSRRVEGENEPPPVGNVPLGGTPTPLFEGEMLDEVAGDYLGPMIRQMRADYKRGMERRVSLGDVPEQGRAQLKRYLNRVGTEMASTKLAAMRYGEQMRDGALLNYNQRYGFDNYANMIFPYQFWYTRSIGKWAQRMVDRPAWFAMYARLKEAQERMEMQGVPSRFKGKMRIPAPFLPEWMGGGLWMDPYQQLFPFKNFTKPFEQMAQEENQVVKRAESILQEMGENGQVSPTELQQAMQTHEGPVWESATKRAELEMDSELNNPAGLVSMIMSPALWLNVPMQIANGKPEKISTLPITRMGRGVRTAFEGTPMEFLGNLVGLAAKPEEKLREMAGLNQFGEWGDYYIDRQLSNLAADGAISARDALMAMMERSGLAYDLAVKRVLQEELVRMPGGLALNQLGKLTAGEAGLKDVVNVPVGLSMMFGSGLLPEGELRLRELKDEYDQAWDAYNQGNKEALTNFYDEHPEYETRLALWKEPEERLQQFLIGEIWDRYFDLGTDNRRLAAEQLGERFETTFLDKTTRAPETVDIDTLAWWSQMLGGDVPRTEATKAVTDMPSFMKETVQVYPDDLVDAIEAYRNERERLFPSFGALQDIYFAIPETEDLRGDFAARNPDLQNYWQWKEQLFGAYPEVKQAVEMYQQQRDTMFPGIFELQDGYFALPERSNQRRQYLKDNPQLKEYWDWKKATYEENPALTWYETERERLFPDYSRLSELYNMLPETDPKRKLFLEQNPQLQEYWDWKRKYEEEHPELEGWFAEQRTQFEEAPSVQRVGLGSQPTGKMRLGPEELAMFSKELIEQLVVHVYAGQEMSTGALMELEDIWERLGEPGEELDVFLEEVVVPSMF